MPYGNDLSKSDVLPVLRSKEEARRFYDRISNLYDFVAGGFEHKFAEMALKSLDVENGEIVLEIGFGTGYCLQRLACLVGTGGRACGIDISGGMIQVARRRLTKAGLVDRVDLGCGDAVSLPYRDGSFDAVFISFTLELLATLEIPVALEEVKRTLRQNGQLGVVSMSRNNRESLVVRLYEWAHQKWPKYLDCRPIYAAESIRDAGFEVVEKENTRLLGLPLEIVIARKTS